MGKTKTQTIQTYCDDCACAYFYAWALPEDLYVYREDPI